MPRGPAHLSRQCVGRSGIGIARGGNKEVNRQFKTAIFYRGRHHLLRHRSGTRQADSYRGDGKSPATDNEECKLAVYELTRLIMAERSQRATLSRISCDLCDRLQSVAERDRERGALRGRRRSP